MLLFFLFPLFTISQVGINNNSPDEKSILDIVATDRGVLIPRLTTAEINAISLSTDAQKGMLVFNKDENCFNFWNKDENAWKNLCGETIKADFTINNCSTISAFGEYMSDQEITPSEYIKLNVTVNKIGPYNIKALSTSFNGYFFEKVGDFIAPGTLDIIIPAVGKPRNPTTLGNEDNFSIVKNGTIVPSCSFSVNVKDSSNPTVFDIQRSSIAVEGVYMQGDPLNPSNNRITLNLVIKSGTGNNYSVETDQVDGISFSGSGVITATAGDIQPIILEGTGTPLASDKITLRINTNSKNTNTIYYVTIELVKPAKRLLALGSNFMNGTNVGEIGTEVNNMLIDTKNFGADAKSIVKSQPFLNNTSLDYSGTGIISRVTIAPNDFTSLLTPGTDKFVDIVVLGYDIFNILEATQMTELADYTKEGGVLIVQGDTGTGNSLSRINDLMQSIFETTTIGINTGVNGPGAVYKFNNITDDDILNGPFGNISGAFWGKDGVPSAGSMSLEISNLPIEDVIIYSTNVNYNSTTPQTEQPYTATMFRHKYYPFIFIGDQGFTRGVTNTGDFDLYPFKVTSKTINSTLYPNFPAPRSSYGENDNQYRTNVYNSTFFANAIAWAIQKSEELRLR